MKIKTLITSNHQKIKYVLLFCLYFVMQYRFAHEGYFETDELDIFLGGKTIAKGYLLYGDFYSQHMPFSYYISAFFELLGAHTVLTQRIYFYLLFSFLWVVICIKYKNVVDERALLISPVIFTFLTCTYDLGDRILSEHLCGVAFVILYLEYLDFKRRKKLEIADAVMISLSIVLSFGTCFVAAYGVAVIGCAFIFLAIKVYFESDEALSIKGFVKHIIHNYYKAILIVAIPWVVLVIYFLAVGTLGEFIYQSYTLNREIYSKYISGFGSDAVSVLWSLPEGIPKWFAGLFSISNMTLEVFSQLVIMILAIVYMLFLFLENREILAVSVIFLFATGTRGLFNFHGTMFVEVLALYASIIVVRITDKRRDIGSGWAYIVILAVFLVSVPYMTYFSRIFNFANNIDIPGIVYEDAAVIDAITDDKEAVWDLTVSNLIPITADRAICCTTGASVIWFYEAYGYDDIYRFYESGLPRVLIFGKDYSIWGYNQSDYATSLCMLIYSSYTQYPTESGMVWIRNDYYDEACRLIAQSN